MRGDISAKPWASSNVQGACFISWWGIWIRVSFSLGQGTFVPRILHKACLAGPSMTNVKSPHKSRAVVAVDSSPNTINTVWGGYVLWVPTDWGLSVEQLSQEWSQRKFEISKDVSHRGSSARSWAGHIRWLNRSFPFIHRTSSVLPAAVQACPQNPASELTPWPGGTS